MKLRTYCCRIRALKRLQCPQALKKTLNSPFRLELLLAVIHSNAATRISRPDSSPPSVIVLHLNISNQPSMNNALYSIQPNATQSQPESTNPVPLSLIAQHFENNPKFYHASQSCFAETASMKNSNDEMFNANC